MRFALLIAPPDPAFVGTIRQHFEIRWRELTRTPLAVLSHAPDPDTLNHPDCVGLALPCFNAPLCQLAEARPYPVVNFSCHFQPRPRAINVFVDNDEIGTLAAELFLAQNYTSFAFSGTGTAMCKARATGFQKALARQHYSARLHTLEPKSLPHPLEYKQWVKRSLMKWMVTYRMPTGIFATNDRHARNILSVLHSQHSPSRSMHGVIGVDDLPPFNPANNGSSNLTTVRPAFDRLGQRAAEVLVSSLHEPDTYSPGSVIKVGGAVVIERESTFGCAPGCPLANEMARWIGTEVKSGRAPSIPEIGAHFNLSPRSASTLFAKASKVSLRDYVMRQRLLRACRLLRDTPKTIGEIAQCCAFSKQGDLNDLFKRHFGVSPSRFRRHGIAPDANSHAATTTSTQRQP